MLIDNNCIICGKGEIEGENACVCDTANHWAGEAGHCSCDAAKGFVETEEGTCACVGKGEIQIENACVCDTANHWTGEAGHCSCDASKGFVETEEGTCACLKFGDYDFMELHGECVEVKQCDESMETYNPETNTCDCKPEIAYIDSQEQCKLKPAPTHPEAQVWDGTTNAWVCDTDSFWEIDPQNPDKCRCIDGYVNMKDGQIDNSSTGKCEKIPECGPKEILQSDMNMCICDTANHWQGIPPNCFCDTTNGKYKEVEDRCETTTVCDPVTQVYLEDTDTCVCNTAENWQQSAAGCTCGGGSRSYVVVMRNGQTICEKKANCIGSRGQKYDAESNTCVCNTDKHWMDNDAGSCRCDDEHRVNVDGNCVCDSENNWYDDGGTCKLCHNYLFNNQCFQIRDTVKFGHYKQSSNTPEPISWIVLDAVPNSQGNGGELLLLSKYVLDNQPWNSGGTQTSWSSSSIRSWLDYDFTYDAFDSKDLSLIVTKQINTNGDITNDSVFFLSPDEVSGNDAYLASDEERKGKATKYALEQGVAVGFMDGVSWWLRTTDNNCAHVVSYYNVVECAGIGASGMGVRPAVWVRY